MFDFLNQLFRKFVQPEFTVVISDGMAIATQGTISKKALAEFTEVAKLQGISKGTIYGFKSKGGITLEFSRDIRKSDHQRFRNALSNLK